MDHTYWLKQTSEPLFPDILWSRPESKAGAGKLLIVGGNLHRFGAPGMAYTTANVSGAGVIKVVLPNAIRKIVKGLLPDADYAASTPSGSFAKNAIQELLSNAQWSELILLAGDFGRNSETAILLESFIAKHAGLICLTQDTVDYFKETPHAVVDRADTIIVLSLAQLQKIFINTPTIMPITLSMGAVQLAEALHKYSADHKACIVTKLNDQIFVAYGGQVSSTHCEDKIWRVETAAKASVFAMQNPTKLFEAITTAIK